MSACICVYVCIGVVVVAAGELSWSRVGLCLVVLNTVETKLIHKLGWAYDCDST